MGDRFSLCFGLIFKMASFNCFSISGYGFMVRIGRGGEKMLIGVID